MLHFHLTRHWFDRFKGGFKTTEYRVANSRNSRILKKALDECCSSLSCALFSVECDIPCKLYCGYPKANDSDRVLVGRVDLLYLLPLRCLPKVEQEFFISRGVDDPNILFYALHMGF